MSRSFFACLVALALPVLPLSGCIAGPCYTYDVSAGISSVTLADDCPTDGGGTGLVADCAIGGAEDAYCGVCQQSSIQFDLRGSRGADEIAVVEIVSVNLLREDGAFLESLTARNPRTFGEEGYETWDETIAAGEELHVTYDISAPDWETIEARDGTGWRYRVDVRMLVDGVERSVSFGPIMREAEIVT